MRKNKKMFKNFLLEKPNDKSKIICFGFRSRCCEEDVDKVPHFYDCYYEDEKTEIEIITEDPEDCPVQFLLTPIYWCEYPAFAELNYDDLYKAIKNVNR